jgi:hypothetical protein
MPIPRPPTPSDPELHLHTSWRGLLGAWITPVVLLGVGSVAVGTGGLRAFPLLLVVLGTVLMLVVLVDYPHRVTVDRTGVSRHTLLRTQRLGWDQLVAMERTRPATSTVVRNATDRRSDPQVSGGLVARGPGRRRWLLTDRVESRIEYDRLVQLVSELGQPVEIGAARPHAEAVPTFLYRRRASGGTSR